MIEPLQREAFIREEAMSKTTSKITSKITCPSVTLGMPDHSQLKKTDPGGPSDPGPQAA